MLTASTLLSIVSLSNGNLLAGLPGILQWHTRLSFPLQLRVSRGIAPLSVSYPSLHQIVTIIELILFLSRSFASIRGS